MSRRLEMHRFEAQCVSSRKTEREAVFLNVTCLAMPDRPPAASTNFQFLQQLAQLLAQLCSNAERNLSAQASTQKHLQSVQAAAEGLTPSPAGKGLP